MYSLTVCRMASDCVIHYPGILFSEKLTPVDEERYKKLLATKEAHFKLGGKRAHYDQASKIPATYKTGLHYHRECYANFTKVRSEMQKREPLSEMTSTSNVNRPQRMETDHAGRFPEYCMFCKEKKAKRIRKGGKDKLEPATVFKHSSAQQTLLDAASKKNDQTLLRCITGVDLQMKKFRRHSSCYLEYTKICWEKEPSGKNIVEQYDKVRAAIVDIIIGERRCMSLDELLDIKKEVIKNHTTRQSMKRWIERNFEEEVVFLTTQNNLSKVVVSKSVWDEVTTGSKPLNSSITSNDEKSTLKEAAEILQDIILDYVTSAKKLPWPPTVESLRERMESTPASLLDFLRVLLSPKEMHHVTSETINRHVESFAQDVIFSITKGSFLTLKHTCVGLGLHSMTGMKLPIVILSHLGHSINYDYAMEIGTAQAEVSEKFDTQNMNLPIQPNDSCSTIPTIFWFDNYDAFVDNTTGAGSIHNTPGIAFQEETSSSFRRPDISVPMSRKRSLKREEKEEPFKKIPKIKPKTNPPLLGECSRSESNSSRKNHLLTLWKTARHNFRTDQRFSRFTGFVIKYHQMKDHAKTVMTYLPPIEKPITDYGTLFEILLRAERLSEEANMKYLHIIMDCGAAMKMFHVIWNNPEKYSKVLIHLGDFHCMQAFFGVIGQYVTGSGFEDIVYQLGLCQPGSMNALIKGKHYNQAWLIHETFSEAVVRIFIETHLPSLPQKLAYLDPEKIDDILEEREVIEYLDEFDRKFAQGLQGEFGATPQYWLMYVLLVDIMQNLHQAIQTNNFDDRVRAWKDMLPFFFFFNKIHYSRYGTQYVEELENMDTKYPGGKEEMMKIGISVRRNSNGIGQAIDLAGEQSYMRNAKTSGGIKSFQTRQCTVLKWVRNRAQQTRFVEELKEIAGIEKTTQNLRKCLRPSEIIKSNSIVERFIVTMKLQFTHPFHASFEKEKLYNLVSGRPVSEDISSSLLSVMVVGPMLYSEFRKRLTSEESKLKFFDPITRNKLLTFKNSILKIKIVSKDKIIKIERDILAILLAESSKNGRPVDINSALWYPLSPAPPAFCTGDGGRRKCTKSDVFVILGDMVVDGNEVQYGVYMEDLAAFVRSLASKCSTLRDLSVLLYKSKPATCKRFYVMQDSYEDDGIKTGERKLRGSESGVRYILNNLEMKIPHDVNSFLAMGENKKDLFQLIQRGIEEQPLEDTTVLFSGKGKMTEVRGSATADRVDLACHHAEADYMFALYSRMEEDILIRSRSGDIDIIVSLIGHQDLPESLYVDNGTGSGRKLLQPSLCELNSEQREALIGYHAFTGNDYVASFFRKGKKTCWKIAKKNKKFLMFFAKLGTEEVTDELMSSAEEYVCALHGKSKLKSVKTMPDAKYSGIDMRRKRK